MCHCLGLLSPAVGWLDASKSWLHPDPMASRANPASPAPRPAPARDPVPVVSQPWSPEYKRHSPSCHHPQPAQPQESCCSRTDLHPPYSCSASPRSPECPPAVSGMREGQSWCPSILQAGHNSIWGWIHQQTKTVCMSRNIWKRRSGSSTFNHLILISLNPFSLCFRCAVPNGIPVLPEH